MKKKRLFLIPLCLLLLAAAWFLLRSRIPQRWYTADELGIPQLQSPLDADGDGVDDWTDMVLGARAYIGTHPHYKSKYYAGGYPDDGLGVCTDVIWQAFRAAGYSLKDLVDRDIADHPACYPNIETPDGNIDFRRVSNLDTFFRRHAQVLTCDLDDPAQWQPGDIVIFGNRAIGGDRVEPYLLVTAGREAHSFEPTPLDVIRISQADVFICNGGESETWVDDILDAAGESIGSVVHMMDHAHVLGEEFSEGMQGGHDHDEHAHDEHDGHDHDGHEEEIEYDEHIWTSPRIAMDLCRVIADTLAQADPAHAQEYQDRLAAYLRELTDLDRAFRDTVEAGQRHLLVFGDRFPLLYFCREYGLDYRAAFHGCSGDTEPSLATLKYLIDKVNQEDIPVVYTIELSSQKVANAIAETTGARVLTFHSCQTLTRQEFDGGETYLSLMWKNVDVLKEGLA